MSITKKQLEAIQKSVGEAVETHVNGKIRTLQSDFNNYVADDKLWKEENQPALDNMKNIRGAFKIFLGFLGLLGLLGAAIKSWGVIRELFIRNG